MTKTWCVGGRHYSRTNNKTVYEKKFLELKNYSKLSMKLVVSVVVINHKFLLTNDKSRKCYEKRKI